MYVIISFFHSYLWFFSSLTWEPIHCGFPPTKRIQNSSHQTQRGDTSV